MEEDVENQQQAAAENPATAQLKEGTAAASDGGGPTKMEAAKPTDPQLSSTGMGDEQLQREDTKVTAAVKLTLMPSRQLVTLAFPLSVALLELKTLFAMKLHIPIEALILKFEGKPVANTITLEDLHVDRNGTVHMELMSNDPKTHPIGPYSTDNYQYQMPDFITVRVTTEKGQLKRLVVDIQREKQRKKPYLGGFRNADNGTEYHNAAMQSGLGPNWKYYDLEKWFCRDAQTYELRHHRQQTFNDTSIQMTGIGVYIPNLEDKLLEPGEYILADVRAERILQQIIILQKNYRRWLAVRKVQALREAKRRRQQWEEEEELRKLKEKEDRLRLEFERKMNPRTSEDFDLLYAALEKWRLEELQHINETLSGADQKAALYMLLEKETDLLAAIDRHKLESGIENMKQCIQNFLNKAAAPKKWRGFDGMPTKMVTPYTLRAKELQDIYTTINMKYLSEGERLDILLTLKHTVLEHRCQLTDDIVELINREVDLVTRRVKNEHLVGLRKRISTLFLQYIRTPAFNPEAANLIKVPQNPSMLRKNIFFCPSCIKYLPSTHFNLSTNSRTSGHCRGCGRLDNIARPRLDLSNFRRLLKALRMAEETYKDGSQYAFLMQELDVRYLVEYIWSGQSILSAWKDLNDLELVRWDKTVHWSPWNCILLTTEEAANHDNLDDLNEAYSEVLRNKVEQKHTWAYNFFAQLPGMARMLSNPFSYTSLAAVSRPLPPNMVNKETQKT